MDKKRRKERKKGESDRSMGKKMRETMETSGMGLRAERNDDESNEKSKGWCDKDCKYQ